MKYMLLVHHDEESFRKRPDTERQQMIQESVHSHGSSTLAGSILELRHCIRLRRPSVFEFATANRLVTDGPFAETREQLGGYFLVNAKDLDEAIGIAARIPGARIGTVEIPASDGGIRPCRE